MFGTLILVTDFFNHKCSLPGYLPGSSLLKIWGAAWRSRASCDLTMIIIVNFSLSLIRSVYLAIKIMLDLWFSYYFWQVWSLPSQNIDRKSIPLAELVEKLLHIYSFPILCAVTEKLLISFYCLPTEQNLK